MRSTASRLGAAALAMALSGALIALPACSPVLSNNSSTAENTGAGAASGQPGLAPITLVHTDDALETFAANSAAAVLNGPDADGTSDDPDSIREKNLCYSPMSLYLACTLVGLGTQGAAQSQLLDALGVSNQEELAAMAQQLRASIQTTGGDPTVEGAAQLKVADSIWVNEGYRFTDAYLQETAALGADALTGVFGTETMDKAMSGWVSEKTNGLLKPRFSTQDGQAAMLLDTVYFKDGWVNPFDVAQNEVGAFHAPGTDIQTPFMRQTISDSSFYQGSNYTAATLPFAGGSTMTFFRPNDDVRLSELLTGTDSILALLQTQPEPAKVDWWLPAFTTNSTMDHLDTSLKAIGVMNIFSPESPDAFAPMIEAEEGSASFSVGQVQQDVHFALDANGVEAAASTAIGIEKMALGPEGEPVTFKLDRPFFYTVTSPDGNLLFIGVVYNPGLTD